MNEDTLIAETEPTEATEPPADSDDDDSNDDDDDSDDDISMGIAY